MKIFLEKISIGTGQSKMKVKLVNNDLTSTEPDFTDVAIVTTNNSEDTTNTNNSLYDVDSVKHGYYSGINEDQSFKLPIIRHQDISQFNDYDFSLSKEVSGTISVDFDNTKFFNRYDPLNNTAISYDGTNFSNVNITPGMTEEEIRLELENVFGSANSTGADLTFVGKEFSELHPNIVIAQNAGTLPFSYVMETDLTKMQNVAPYGHVDINLFKTKNHLKNDYNIYVDSSDRLIAWRRYKSIDSNFENIWMSYTVDFGDSSTNEYLTRNYETVEHIDGFVKYKSEDSLHKSNIYSIRIYNSGLNAEGQLFEEIRNIFEKAVFNMMTKITPAHCQLWKIEYIDE